MADEADLGAFMASVEEPQAEEAYIDEPGHTVQGLYNLKASNLIPTERSKNPLALGGRHSYDYIPQYIIKAAEEQIEKHYNPEPVTVAVPAPVEEYKYTKTPRFAPGSRDYERVGVETPAPVVIEGEPITKKYQRNGQKIEYEETPLIEAPTAGPTPAEKLKEAEAMIAQPPVAVITKSVIPMPIEQEKPITAFTQYAGPAPPAPEAEKPIAAFAGQTNEDRLRAMVKEIEILKQKQEELKRIRDLKLEKLKLIWHNITAGIKAKHPYITALIEKAVKAAPGIGRAALSAGKSFAQGLGNLAMKVADPYQRQNMVNSIDVLTRDFAPEGSQQSAVDRLNGKVFVPQVRAPVPQQPIRMNSFRPMQTDNRALEKEAENLRLQRSIIRNRAQLKNDLAIIKGEKLPYPTLPSAVPTRRKKARSIRGIEGELERLRLQRELDREKRLVEA